MRTDRFSRRTFVKASLATGASASISPLGLTPDAWAQATPTGSERSIVELRVAVPTLPDTMDPQEQNGIAWSRVQYSVFDTLIRRDFFEDNELVPSLATAWRRVNDTTFDVTLRQDVTWQDGTPFTSEDVTYTFDRILSGDPELVFASPSWFPLASVEALDDYHVRFVTDGLDPVLEKRLADNGASIIPAMYHQKIGADAFRTRPIGTGPYRMTEFVADDRLAFEAYDRYFGGMPAAQKVTIRLVPEVATRIAALLNGEVDLITNIPPDLFAQLQEEDAVTVLTVTVANQHQLLYNLNAQPLARREIRQALNDAIDRQTLVESLWGGNAVHTRGFQYEGEEFYDPSRPLTPYDPDRARALLAEGGYAGEEITYLTYAPDYYTNEGIVGEAIVAMWQQVGINARLVAMELQQHIGEWQSAESPYHVTTWSAGSNGDPDSYLMGGWGPGSAAQVWWTAESAARFNELGQQARSTLDRSLRGDLYRQMLDEFENEAPGTSLYQTVDIYAMANTIDWTPYPLFQLDFRPYNLKAR